VRRKWIIVTVVVAGAAIALGVVLAVNITSHPHSQTAELKTILDKVPLPADVVLVTETDTPAKGANSASLHRTYRLPSGADVSAQIVHTLQTGGYHPFNLQTGKIDDELWQSAVGPTDGDLMVVPADRVDVGIQVRWANTQLMISLDSSDVG